MNLVSRMTHFNELTDMLATISSHNVLRIDSHSKETLTQWLVDNELICRETIYRGKLISVCFGRKGT